MKFDFEEKYNAAVIKPKGNLTGGPDAEDFHNFIHKLIDEKKNNVIIDLSNVKYVNSTGIGILMRGYTTLKNSSGSMKLAHLSDKISGLLSITKLNQIFDIYNSVEEAANS